MESSDAIEGLSALAHPGRLAVFRLLVTAGEAGVPAGDIARQKGVPANSMSNQLAILARAGLIQARRESRSIIYSADYPRIRGLLAFLMEDCCQGLPAIVAPLESITTGGACCVGDEGKP